MGFATTTQEHGHERWSYYLLPLAGGSLPWAVYLAPGLWQAWLDAAERPAAVRWSDLVSLLRSDRRTGVPVDRQLEAHYLCVAVVPSGRHPRGPCRRTVSGPRAAARLRHDVYLAVSRLLRDRVRVPICAVGGVRSVHEGAVSGGGVRDVCALPLATTLMALLLMARQRREAAVAAGSLWFAALIYRGDVVADAGARRRDFAEGIGRPAVGAARIAGAGRFRRSTRRVGHFLSDARATPRSSPGTGHRNRRLGQLTNGPRFPRELCSP